ncbi:MAG: hypothetical protein RMX57_09005 [Planktomarina sp.]|nr:hypothetical protein [Planktomarina sp.]
MTKLDPRWLYSARVDVRDISKADLELPEGISHVIALGHEMDQDLVCTYPSLHLAGPPQAASTAMRPLS